MRVALVRLYPVSWRERYGDEFEAMLEELPTTVGNVADVVLGAVDAHLTAKAPENRGWWLRRLPGFLLTLGGLVWLGAQTVNWRAGSPGLENFSAQVVLLGILLTALACLTVPTFRSGAGRFGWLGSILPFGALMVLVPVQQLGLLGIALPLDLGSLAVASVVLSVFGQLAWSGGMALLSPRYRPAMLALVGAILLNLTVGHLVVTGPDYPSSLDRFIGWLIPASWTLVGLSVMRTRASRVTAAS